MKTIRSQCRSAGNTLLLTLVTTAIVSFVLVAYLKLVTGQNYNTVRSQAWNSVVPVIVAGIEEALAHLNTNGTNNNIACDGWTRSGDIYSKDRTIEGGRYYVTITNWFAGRLTNAPVIESRGYVDKPLLVASASHAMLAYLMPWNDTSARNQVLARGVRVRAKQDFLFAKGMVAKGMIDLKGNDITTDSFDSSDPAYNTNGRYDPNKVKPGGDVATNSGVTNSLNVGNANIYGRVSTGPGGSVELGPTGSVGDFDWKRTGHTGIQPGWSRDDMNVDFPEVRTSAASGAATPTSGTSGEVTYDYVLGTDNYSTVGALSLVNQQMVVTGNAVLYVAGDFSLSGLGSITIVPGASLTLYVAGTRSYIGGNGVINQTGNAANFLYYGLDSNTAVDFYGNGTFVGCVYAPNADFTLGGGGREYQDFIGGSVSKSVTMNGHYKFHYDEALNKFGPPRAYVVTSWNEMSPQEVAAVPTLSVVTSPISETTSVVTY